MVTLNPSARVNKNPGAARTVGEFSGRVPVSTVAEAYPEYPGASLTETILTYSSVVDPTKTNLKVRIYFPTGKTNLPLCSCIHGFDQIATDMSPSEDQFRRIARTGKFVAAFEMRGSSGSGGTITFANDMGGRQKFDVRDGEDAIEAIYSANLAYTAGVLRREIYSQSAGGTVSIGMARAFPDRYVNVTAYYPVVNPITWDTFLGAGARQTSLRSYIGGTPAAVPDEWNTRNGNLVTNILSELYFACDTADASVGVVQSTDFRDALSAAGKTFTYNQSTVGDTYRWSHGSPDAFPDLIQLEPLWKNKVKIGSIRTMPSTGTFDVPGCLVTRSFQIMLSDGNLNNSGRCRTGTYNLATGVFTNTSSLYCVAVYKNLSTGAVDAQIVDAGGTCTFSPVVQTSQGYAIGMRFKVDAQRVLKDGSNNVSAICDLTGGWANQGYALRFVSAKPLYVANALNGRPKITFTAASSQYVQGELIKALQGKSKLTIISVTDGVIWSHGASASELTQLAISGGNYFDVIANGSGTNGSHPGSATMLVRTIQFDGTQSTNATRLVVSENKVDKTLTFTGTIPATTESNTSSVMTIGKRTFDASFFGGSFVDVYATPDVTMNNTERNAEVDTLKTEYSV